MPLASRSSLMSLGTVVLTGAPRSRSYSGHQCICVPAPNIFRKLRLCLVSRKLLVNHSRPAMSDGPDGPFWAM